MCHMHITVCVSSQPPIHYAIPQSHAQTESPSYLLRSGSDDSSLRSSPWGLVVLALFFVARFQHLLNQLQHSAISDLLSDKGHELFVIHGPKIVFQIRIDDPLASGPHFTPDLAQGVGRLAAFAIPKATRIKDLFKDRFQTIDQGLLADPVIDRGYAQGSGLAGSPSLRDLQSSHSLRLVGLLSEISMKPVQVLIQTCLKIFDRDPVSPARSSIGDRKST